MRSGHRRVSVALRVRYTSPDVAWVGKAYACVASRHASRARCHVTSRCVTHHVTCHVRRQASHACYALTRRARASGAHVTRVYVIRARSSREVIMILLQPLIIDLASDAGKNEHDCPRFKTNSLWRCDSGVFDNYATNHPLFGAPIFSGFYRVNRHDPPHLTKL